MDNIDITSEVNFIWSIANRLRGTYQSDKYKDVIIPMVIIRRFECALNDTKQKVLEQFLKNPDTPPFILQKFSGYDFYNTSKFDLTELCHDEKDLKANFIDYINSFSQNVKDIISDLEFDKQIDKMDKGNNLYSIVKAFSELDLNPKTIDNIKMGYIFEDIIRRFSENAEAGDHYTGRDIIRLMVNILLVHCPDLQKEGRAFDILDQACGTGGMLSTANDTIKKFNQSAYIKLYGQEINPESYAICKADMLIKGQNADNICKTDTLIKDEFIDTKFDFVIENPPFGTAWGGKEARSGVEIAVKNAFKTSRFPAGLPSSGDAQMLFLQSALDKIKPEGKVAIIQNGSPLFSGGVSSGESQIRKYLLENDYIDAIIALPTDLFYNTGIATYIWILDKNKNSHRKGKIQLINANGFFVKLRKAMGNKRNELNSQNIEDITQIYKNFEENEFCKIYPNTEFIYKEYSVFEPLQRSYAICKERLENLPKALSSFFDEAKFSEFSQKSELNAKEQKEFDKLNANKAVYEAIFKTLNENLSDEIFLQKDKFTKHLNEILKPLKLDKKLLEKISHALSKPDPNAQIQRDKNGEIIYDKESKDTEIIKFDENIDEYMRKEVLPHKPNAKASFEYKIGAEIPFTRYFYKYSAPKDINELEREFLELCEHANELTKRLFSDE